MHDRATPFGVPQGVPPGSTLVVRRLVNTGPMSLDGLFSYAIIEEAVARLT